MNKFEPLWTWGSWNPCVNLFESMWTYMWKLVQYILFVWIFYFFCYDPSFMLSLIAFICMCRWRAWYSPSAKAWLKSCIFYKPSHVVCFVCYLDNIVYLQFGLHLMIFGCEHLWISVNICELLFIFISFVILGGTRCFMVVN